MNESLFDLLKKKGLTKKNVEKKIKGWSNKKLTQFIRDCEYEALSGKTPSASRFSFVASSSLSGDIHPCSMYKCRLDSIKSLGKFASLYSDRVLVQNPFSKYCHPDAIQAFGYKEFLVGDLKVLLEVEPLAKENLLGVCGNSTDFCPSCFKKSIGEKAAIKRKHAKVTELLEGKYLKKIKLRYEKKGAFPSIVLSGPEEVIEHSAQTWMLNPQSPENKVFSRHTLGKEVKNESVKRHFFHMYLQPFFDDLLVQDIYARSFGYNSVTNNTQDFFVRSNLESIEKNLRISQILKNLQQAVPSIENIELESLVKLRRKETESLKVFRDSLNNLFSRIEKGTNDKEVKEIVEAEISTEINKLDLLFKKNKEEFSKSFMRKAVVGSAFLSVGLFSGLVPPSAGTALAAVGGYNFMDALSKDMSKIFRPPKEVQTSNYYFLWKLKQL